MVAGRTEPELCGWTEGSVGGGVACADLKRYSSGGSWGQIKDIGFPFEHLTTFSMCARKSSKKNEQCYFYSSQRQLCRSAARPLLCLSSSLRWSPFRPISILPTGSSPIAIAQPSQPAVSDDPNGFPRKLSAGDVERSGA